MMSTWSWIERTTVATVVRDSLLLTAGLSALHILSVAAITGAALLYGLRYIGILFPREPLSEVVRVARRVIA